MAKFAQGTPTEYPLLSHLDGPRVINLSKYGFINRCGNWGGCCNWLVWILGGHIKTKSLPVWSLHITILSKYGFVNRCGEWHYWGGCCYWTLNRVVCILSVSGKAKSLQVWSLHVLNLCPFSFVNRCGDWCYWEGWWYQTQNSRVDRGVSMHIGCEWQGQISSSLVSTRLESLSILLCQQVWRLMLLRRRMLPDTKQGGPASRYAYWVWVARPNLFKFGLYKSWIFGHSALSTGVEIDTIEEEDATRH